MIIQPTHTCFDDALDMLCDFYRLRKELVPDLRLVHGICQADDGPFAHAWLEDDTTSQVLFVGLVDGERVNLACDRKEFYEHAHVRECTRYTIDEAIWLNRKHENFGPWQVRYRVLCQPRGSLASPRVLRESAQG